MINIENIETWGFEHAVRGMRNPLNSWSQSDSYTMHIENPKTLNTADFQFVLGDNDLALMRKLFDSSKTGNHAHRKYLRQIFVSMDIVAPLYWWKEFDAYKVGTTANSCSTMHTIAKKEFTLDDFSWENLLNTGLDLFSEEKEKGLFTRNVQPLNLFTDYIIPSLNKCREAFIKTENKIYWWQIIQLLPSSFNQRRTVTMNYENVVTIIKQRSGHKLDEWREMVEVLKELPYIRAITEDV